MSAKDMAFARLTDESDALKAKIDKLEDFDHDKVSRTQAKLLGIQLELMRAYYDILQARICAWDIDD